MFETEQEGKQYIEGLKAQLVPMAKRMNELKNTPDVVRTRKNLEAEYVSLQGQVKQLEEKIKMASTRYEEMMAMEEAQGAGQRISDNFQKNIKVAAIVSGIALVSIILGVIIYKKVKSK